MKRLRLSSLALFGLFLVLPEPGAAQVEADLVLRGGRVYTVDSARSWASAVAVDEGRIAFVGTDSAVAERIGPGTRVVELDGRMVLPGFHDAHVHPATGGIELLQCDLNSAETRAELLDLVRECGEEGEPGEWLMGGGWNLPLFPGGVARAVTLDSLVADRPVYLTSSDGHSAWVNSRAMELAGIGPETQVPAGGRIDRDPGTGRPLGTLRESAMRLVSAILPDTTAEQRRAGLRAALEMANRFGITSLVEANAAESALATYLAADREGWLTARVVASQNVDPAAGPEQIRQLDRRRAGYRGERLRAGAAKIFADGVIEAQTAALLEPYVGATGDRGSLSLPPERLRELVVQLDSAGFQVHIHAIGDRGIRESLDALELARDRNGARDSRHHLAHIQLWNSADVPRLRELGVIANFQPLWAYADSYITELTEPVLGPERSRWLYPIRSVLDSGAIVAAGSDWSVTSMNPLHAIQVAVTRQPLDASQPSWLPQERASLAEMIAAYTIGGAYLMRQETETGSIEVGKAADLIVLDRDLFEVDPHSIHLVEIDLTMLEGTVVFER